MKSYTTTKIPLLIYLTLFLFLFAIYLLTYTPRINASDGLAMFATAESFIRRGALDVEQIRWMDLQQGTYGLDGLLYSRKGMGVPIGMLPLVWLGFHIPIFGMVTTGLLFNAMITALTAVLLMHYLYQLGFAHRVGLIVALTFGLSTLAWPYAKSLFSDPFSGFLLLITAYCLLRFKQAITTDKSIFLWVFLAGLFMAWNVATRYAEAIFIPIFGLYWFINRWLQNNRRWSDTAHQLIKPATIFATPLILVAGALFAFNLSRYGNPLNTGYLPNESFSGVWWQGIIGQLFSPGRGLLLYCPIFLLSFVGLIPFWQRFRAETLLAGAIILIHLLLYGKWFMWHGGYAWGPRFMIPTLPFWAMFLAPVVEKSLQKKQISSKLLLATYFCLFSVGLIPQLLSVVIDFAPFQNSLLEAGLPLFAPETFFEWHYSPFVDAWSFITLQSLDLAWAWQGQINWLLLLILLINCAVCGLALATQIKTVSPIQVKIDGNSVNLPKSKRIGSYIFIFPLISTLMATTFLLHQAHQLPAQHLQQTINHLNQHSQPTDAIIINDPELTMPFAELYKGQATVLGVQQGGTPLPLTITQRIQDITQRHPQVWWLPNWLPPHESGVEQILLTEGFRADEQHFADQRLVLFATSAKLPNYPLPNQTIFAETIELISIAYLVEQPIGQALPIELHWQTAQPLTENYHLFIHLLNKDGNLGSQSDGQPVNWTRPTSTWQVGEPIVDRQALWLPIELVPGTYRLRIGWYNPVNGQRLLLADGQDALEFGITIINP